MSAVDASISLCGLGASLAPSLAPMAQPALINVCGFNSKPFAVGPTNLSTCFPNLLVQTLPHHWQSLFLSPQCAQSFPPPHFASFFPRHEAPTHLISQMEVPPRWPFPRPQLPGSIFFDAAQRSASQTESVAGMCSDRPFLGGPCWLSLTCFHQGFQILALLTPASSLPGMF